VPLGSHRHGDAAMRMIQSTSSLLGGQKVPATQGDVARRAGVSPRTVSNVVNEFPLVSDDVRQRVQRAIEELGYQPNLAARNLRRGRTGMIGLAVPELSVPYFSELADFIIQEASRHSYTVVIEQTDGAPDRERELLRQNERGHLFDGLIVSPLGLGSGELQRNAGGIPVVLLGEHIAHGPYDHVGIDNVAAARDATAALIGLGRRRIAAIGHQSRSPGETGQLRSAGYRQALESAGLPFRKSLVIPAPSYHRSSGAAAMEQLLRLPQPPDAVFCYNDLLAIGAMRTILSQGLRIPDDIAVVGFDDIEDSRYSFPSLTTISPDKQEIARLAIAQLFQRLKGDNAPPVSHQVEYCLVRRESTQWPPAGSKSDDR
jgi:LacI family transcriptional regulator, repressor for deo operon, udp, cdd, tsx, nupC, and nupG